MSQDDQAHRRCPCDSGRDFEACCLDAARAAKRLSPGRLLAWASGQGVGEQLSVQASVISGRPLLRGARDGHWYDQRLTVGELLAVAPTMRMPATPELEAARVEAWRFLGEEIDSVRLGLAQEAEPRPEPAGATVRLLVEQLRELRTRVRATVSPRAVSRLPLHALSTWRPGRQISYVERRRVKVTGTYAEEPKVILRLQPREAGPLLVPPCSCRWPGACTHVLAAIDASLAQLCLPEPPVDWLGLAEDLGTPGWAKVLGTLEKLHARHRRRPAGPEDLQLSFLVDDLGRGQVQVTARRHDRKRGGGYGAGKRLRREDLERAAALSPEDQAVVRRLALESRPFYGYGHEYGHRAGADLEALVGHPRVFLRGEDGPMVVRPAMLGLALHHGQGRLRLDPCVDGEYLTVEEAVHILTVLPAPGVFLHARPERQELLAVRVQEPALTRTLVEALAAHGQTFPVEAAGELLERLDALQALLPVEVPEGLAGAERPASGHLVLRVTIRPQGLDLEVLARPLEGGPLHPPGEGPAKVVALTPAGRSWCRRDLPREQESGRALLAGLPLAGAREEAPFRLALRDDAAALELLGALQVLSRPDVTVAWGGPPAKVLRASGAAGLQVKVRDRGDWFGVDGTVEVDGEQVALALLLEALREQRTVVRLQGGGWLTITGLLAERLAPLAQLSSETREGVEVGPSALGVLDDLRRDGATLDADGAFARLHQRMKAAAQRSHRLPRTFKGKLRDYQLEGFRWLARLADWGAGAVLADDMGLGKTLQALALLCHRAGEGPALVVAPTSVCSNWVSEAGRFAPSLRVRLFRDALRASAIEALGPGDVLVVSYGLLALDLERFRGKDFATLVLDEAQAVKNAATRRARAARELTARFRVALSGTPVENHLGELWSIYRVVFPGLLGSWELFRQRFALPIERRHDEARRRALSATVRPFLLRRTKAEVARELPTRTEIVLPVVLGPGERRHYDQARLAALARLEQEKRELPPAQRRFQVLAAITRLRLLACHPRLQEEGSRLDSAKLARFMALAGELCEGGHRTLVFSQFTGHLALVREALDAARLGYLYLDGQTPPAKRDELVARFQAGEAPLFLISLKAGGTGLNLTAADYVVHLDPWWNPAVEDQATDRAHRIGQRRPVTVYRLVSQGTVEEAIVGLHGRKRALVDGVLGGMEAAGKLSPEALMALVRAGGEPAHPEGPVADARIDAEAAALEAVASADPEAAEDVAGYLEPPRAERPGSSAAGANQAGGRATGRAGAAGPSLPGALEALLARFRAMLEAEHAEGKVATRGPQKSYPRAARRFLAWAAGQGVVEARLALDFEALAERYLHAVLHDEVEAPDSDLVTGRTALNRLRRFMDQG